MTETYKAVVKKNGTLIRSWSGNREDVIPEFTRALKEERDCALELWCDGVCVHSAAQGREQR